MRLLQVFRASVGTKLLIALTGLSLFGFLVFHLYGNLLMFRGAGAYNAHAAELIDNPLIIPAEIGLLLLFVLHIYKAVTNWVHNRQARAQGYTTKKWAGGPSRKSVGSTTMIWTGLVTILFVIIHLDTFKWGPVYAAAVAPGQPPMRDLYRLVVEVFHRPAYVAWYVAAMSLLFLHLRHGVSSAFQSLGLMPAAWTRVFLRTGLALAILVAGGFLVIPLAVYFFL